jgi:hypothetical protein
MAACISWLANSLASGCPIKRVKKITTKTVNAQSQRCFSFDEVKRGIDFILSFMFFHGLANQNY